MERPDLGPNAPFLAAEFRRVSDGYFSTVGIALDRGTSFADAPDRSILIDLLVAGVLVGTGLLAAALPARRATRVEPVVALKD